MTTKEVMARSLAMLQRDCAERHTLTKSARDAADAKMAEYDAAHPEIAAICAKGVRDYENRQSRLDGPRPNRDSGLTAENLYDLDTEME
jgi:hypothetical protein